jgi:hypothetical protein
MKKLNIPLLAVLLGFAFFLTVFILLCVIFAGQFAADPPKLVEEYAKFLGGLVTVLAGFFLINVFWEKKQRGEQTDHSRQIVLSFGSKIVSLCQEITRLLRLEYPVGREAQSQQRDETVIQLGLKLKNLGGGLEKNLTDLSLLDEITMKEGMVNIWSDVLSPIDRLEANENFRIELEKFKLTITQIQEATQNLIITVKKG